MKNLPEWTTRLFKVFEHNPFVTLAVIGLVVAQLWISGCNARVQSSVTGKNSTAEEIRAATAGATEAIEDRAAEVRSEIAVITGNLQARVAELESLGGKADRLIETANGEIEIANAKTEEANRLLQTIGGLVQTYVPGIPPEAWATIIRIGGIGDSVRKRYVIRKKDERISELEASAR